ncbi:MAG: biotin--[acetyl-CoA-carboxylase] ligase [Eubacterium sp.]|nr:biotin--[acetyl-CoA-carboxylase] ligase [Eubacterium sp.]
MNTKEALLRTLEENKGEYISGESLASRLSVSRNAVWKAARALREDGYDIESVSRKGYRLVESTDILSAPGIEAFTSPISLEVFDSIDSTNEELKRKALSGAPHGALVVANQQTAGKGRRGRPFYSPSDTGLYMSVLLRLDLDFSESVLITTASSVAVARAIEKVCGVSTGIKWVNDIYMNGRKVCGILSEAVTDIESGSIDSIVVGIGVNVSTGDFPGDFSERASSIFGDGRTHSVRNRLAAAIYDELMEVANALPDKEFLEEYRRRSVVLGKRIRYSKGNDFLEGEAVDIDAGGGLVVESDTEGRITLSTGEITIRGDF